MIKKILLISWKVPPEISGSATVVYNLVKQFKHNELIVAGERPPSLSALINTPPDLPQVHYLITGLPLNVRGKDKWRLLQFPIILIRTINLIRKQNIDVVVAVFPSTEFLLAGYLAARWVRKPFFPYYHNTFVENRLGLTKVFARWLQRRMFSESNLVFLLSEGLAQYYRSHYPETSFSVLPHSFNGPIPSFSFPPIHEPIRLVILGTIGEACMDATKRVCEAVTKLENCHLMFISRTPRKYLEKMGLLSDRITHNTVSHSTLRNHLTKADIMVLPHGFRGGYSDVEYQTIFPTRTIDYLISGRPILAHSPTDSFLTHYLAQNGCALVVSNPNSDELVSAIESLRKDDKLRSELVENALRAAKPFQASRVAVALKAQIWS